jgi:hypothetical protein
VATQVKLQRKLSPQLIPPNTWTLLTFDTVIRNDEGMAQAMSLIVPKHGGDFIWGRNIRWEPLTIPEGDVRVRQFMSRFIRDPLGERDDTGAGDGPDTPGRDYRTEAWFFYGEAGEPVGLEVWHDHHEAAYVGQAQFVGMTWDY